MNIPLVDLAPLLQMNDDAAITKTAKAIKKACLEHGFFYVKNHGIPEELQAQLESSSKTFFALPDQEKMKISMKLGGSAWRGYFAVGDEFTSGKPDQKEGLYFGSELSDSNPKVAAGIPMHGANLFPSEPIEMRQTVLDHIHRTTEVGHAILRGIAVSLGLSPYYFEKSITSEPFILFRIFHYPGRPKDEPNWGVGEHTDYGLLTILKQDDNGGLEVKSNGKWISAPPIEGTFICNIGDMLDRMTGGKYVSTAHRVRNTSGQNRLSFPLFFDPNFDSVVNRIPGYDTLSLNSSRWDGQNVYDFKGKYGDYLLGKVSKVFPDLFKKVLK